MMFFVTPDALAEMVSGGWPQYSYSKSQWWHRPMLWWPHTSKPFQEFSPGSFLKTSRCTFTTSWVKLCSSFWPVFVEILSLSCPNPMESNTWGPSWMKPRTKNLKTPSDRMLCNIKIRRTVSNCCTLTATSLNLSNCWYHMAWICYAKNLPNQALYGCQRLSPQKTRWLQCPDLVHRP